MTKILTILFISLFCYQSVVAQERTVTGVVLDSLRREVVEYASVRFFTDKDTTFVKGGSTDANGKFAMKMGQGNYLLEISFMGYSAYKQSVIVGSEKENIELGKIYLQSDSKLLDELVITAKVPDIVVKGDTIEYNAESYMSDENDLLQDILKNIPGVEIDANGKLTANGKPINKILVDGKEFFGNDIQMALENLPANMIKKLQLFKEESETAKITGFKDGGENQVLNLTIKEEFKQSFFGDVRAGYGSNDKYSNSAMLNYMHGDNQMSVVGSMNNVSGSSSGGFSPYSGEDKNKSTGANFSIQKSDRFKIGGNVRYSDNTNILETKDYTQHFDPAYISHQNSSNTNNRKNFNLGVNLEWKPDSLTTIYFRTAATQNKNNDRRQSDSRLITEPNDTTQQGSSNTRTRGDGNSFNGSLVVGRKLNDKGRTISVNLNGNIRKDDSKGTNYTFTKYSTGEKDRIIDQITSTDNTSNNWSASVVYVEPLTSKESLMFSYMYRQGDADRVRDAFKKDGVGDYTAIDTAYMRKSTSYSSSQNINVSFQSLRDKFEYSVGFNISPSYSKSKVIIVDSLADNPKQRVVNYSPTARFKYKFKENTSFEIDYTGSTEHPSISQISKDTTYIGSTRKMYGNPNLKRSFRNEMSFSFYKSDFESGRFLMVSARLNNTLNSIADYTVIDSSLNTSSTYKNVNGNWGGNIWASYNTPFRNKKFSVNLHSYVYYNSRVGFTNGEKSITDNLNLSPSVGFKFKTDKLESYLNLNYSFNLTMNSLASQKDITASDYGVNNTTTVKLPYDITIKNELSFKYNSGYSSDFKKTELIWNASVSKSLLKNKKGILKFEFYDILDDRNNVMRVVTDIISDTRTNTVNRYFLATFTYKFNIAKGGSSADELDMYY